MGNSGAKEKGLVSLPLTLLPTSSIHPSKFRLRRELGDLSELKESISRVGLLQPIIVRREGRRYEVVSGHRRLASCADLGITEILSTVTDMDDKTAFEVQLTENIQRESFAPLEEARAFYSYVGMGRNKSVAYGSISELARRIGKSQEYISNRIRLLRLPGKLLEKMLAEEGFTVSHAEEIAALASSPELAKRIGEMVFSNKMSVRELERAVPLIKSGVDVESAARLARSEVRLRPKWDAQPEADDSVEILLKRAKRLLESTLSYVDGATSEIEEDRELYEVWVNEVRGKIHEAIDGVIFAEKVRHGRPRQSHTKPGEEPLIWAVGA